MTDTVGNDKKRKKSATNDSDDNDRDDHTNQKNANDPAWCLDLGYVRLFTQEQLSAAQVYADDGVFAFVAERDGETLAELATRFGLTTLFANTPEAQRAAAVYLPLNDTEDSEMRATLAAAQVPAKLTMLFGSFVPPRAKALLVRKSDGVLVLGNAARRLLNVPELPAPPGLINVNAETTRELAHDSGNVATLPRVEGYSVFVRCDTATPTLRRGEPILVTAAGLPVATLMKHRRFGTLVLVAARGDAPRSSSTSTSQRRTSRRTATAVPVTRASRLSGDWIAHVWSEAGLTMCEMYLRDAEEPAPLPADVLTRLEEQEFELDESQPSMVVTVRPLEESVTFLTQLGVIVTREHG
jgi:antitoxin (DNA-binding transcriptional repressor) of toxin-antitoxin stability system